MITQFMLRTLFIINLELSIQWDWVKAVHPDHRYPGLGTDTRAAAPGPSL